MIMTIVLFGDNGHAVRLGIQTKTQGVEDELSMC